MLEMPEWMQLLSGTSISLNSPANGTAGSARELVSGQRSVPAPPPKIMAEGQHAADAGPQAAQQMRGNIADRQHSVSWDKQQETLHAEHLLVV
jgi:hypothetical protein